MVVDSLFWTATPIDWDRYRSAVKERLWDRFPVFRSVVVRGADGGWYWEEQPDADHEARYEHVVLPEPGGDAELQDADLRRNARCPSTAVSPCGAASWSTTTAVAAPCVLRAHHSIADGIRMVQLSLSIFDATPDGAAVAREHRAQSPGRQEAGTRRTHGCRWSSPPARRAAGALAGREPRRVRRCRSRGAR